MPWFKSRYVQSLEMEISRLRISLEQQKSYSESLIERLLLKNNVPTVMLPEDASKESMQKYVSEGGGGIFDDVDEVDDEVPGVEDNRKEKQFDSFVL